MGEERCWAKVRVGGTGVDYPRPIRLHPWRNQNDQVPNKRKGVSTEEDQGGENHACEANERESRVSQELGSSFPEFRVDFEPAGKQTANWGRM